jgi:G3E family GTPase
VLIGKHHEHDDSVTTVTLIEEGEVDLHEFTSWLGSWLWKEEQKTGNNSKYLLVTLTDVDVFRCKGVVAVRDEPEKHVLQGVHQVFDVEPISGLLWKEGEKRATKLVFIGRQLDAKLLKSSFVNSCLNKSK